PEAFTRLVSEGYLSRLITKRTQTKLNTEGVGERGGDYIEAELNVAVERQHDVTVTAVNEMIAMRRSYHLVFATSVTHAYEIADILKLKGEQVEVIHGGIPKKQRSSMLTAFKNKELKWLINVNVLTTGFDAPHVDLLGILRPSKSVGLWVQI
ncbi:DEAD/DEAH box helicase, partial [Rahnella perminowiae]|uniref:DEAD/DEAH box helicase n=1 Tax=Rahnella perminowiae TaxID=2816244 RepID=UPI0023680A64